MNGRLSRVVLIVAAWSLAVASSPFPIGTGMSLRAGAARVDITPDVPLALEGYVDPETRISTGVHDRLYARATAFSAGSERLVFISCDIGSFNFAPYFVRRICEKWDLGADRVFLCATHTHSGPQLSLNPDYPHPNNFRYTHALEQQLVDVTGRALATMVPARVSVGRGSAAVGISRRKRVDGRVEMAPNPDGAADPEVLVLKVSRRAGGPLAILFDYASHSRSLRRANRLISGDIFGVAEQVVEHSDPGIVAAAFAGASGDIDPAEVVDSFDAPAGGVAPTTRLGTVLGDEVARAAALAQAARLDDGIRAVSARVMLPPKIAGQAKWVNVLAAAVGEVAFVGLDCEASVEIGLAIKRASPFAATFVLTNANGWVGYLPTARQHDEGGYEVARTGFGPGAGDVLVKETRSMLDRLRAPRPH